MYASEQFDGTKIHNVQKTNPPSIGKIVRVTAKMATKDSSRSTPSMPIPVEAVTRGQLDALSNDTVHVIRLGHSSLLLKLMGQYWLIDPVFSKRASSVSFAGPKRFHAPPITLDELPPIHRVLISHNHFDHLDRSTIAGLVKKTDEFLVPLGVEAYLHEWGIPAEKTQSFDWWQALNTETSEVVFTPAQHFSGRSLTDRDKTLWGSWVIRTSNESLFFSGDTGYSAHFKSIGKRYGPFDLTLIETGAYAREWFDMHLMPEQSVQAHRDLRGKILLPIHNSTFDLAFHPWTEPFERVEAAASEYNVELATPTIGQVVTVNEPPETIDWWPKNL